jgi:hypothetical protein
MEAGGRAQMNPAEITFLDKFTIESNWVKIEVEKE